MQSKKFREKAIDFLRQASAIVEENFPKDCYHLSRLHSKLKNVA
jgi:hypothetical protein